MHSGNFISFHFRRLTAFGETEHVRDAFRMARAEIFCDRQQASRAKTEAQEAVQKGEPDV